MGKLRWISILLLAFAFLPAALAQSWPTKPVKILTGFPPGGPGDTTSRILGEEFAKAFGQPVVVENKPGAGGNIAAYAVAQSPPDGYTLFSANSGALGVNPTLYEKLPFDAAKDFQPITMMVVTPMVFFVSANSPHATLGDLIAALKKDGARMNYGSPGIGTLPHIVGERFKSRLNVASTHVPYRGATMLVEDVANGDLHWSLDAPINILSAAKAGRIRLIAITAAARWPTLPEVPTTAEAGVPDFIDNAWFALVGPAGMPRDIVMKLHGVAIAALKKPDVVEKLLNLGLEAKPMSPQETEAYIAETRARWGAVVKATGMKVE